MKDKAGQRCFRKVQITTVFPKDTLPDKSTVQVAPPNKAFNEEGIEQMLITIAARLEAACPQWDFNIIELSPLGQTARYVFRYSGIKMVPSSVPIQTTPLS